MEGNFKRTKFVLAILLLIFLCFSLFPAKRFGGVFVFAAEDLNVKCLKYINEEGDVCKGMSEEKCQEELNECLEFYEQQSDYYEGKVSEKQKEKKTLENKVYVLRNKINKLNSDIYTSNLMIKDLGIQIDDTQESIGVTTGKIGQSQERLAELLRLIEEQDRRSLLEVMLEEDELSDFFDELAALESLSLKNQELLIDIRTLKGHLEDEEENLSSEKQDFEYSVITYEIQKDRSQGLKSEEESLLKITKGQEELYQQHLKEIEAKATEMRAKIFQLAGVSDSDAPSFGEALELAKWVQKQTGVRPAFLLSIITQESSLGRDVGQCYIADKTSGASVGMNTGRRFTNGIHPTRDLPSFLKITQGLGRDPMKTPISCPATYGWGGAMGPAQFIPSTWFLVKDKVVAILGRDPNPWSIRDSFLASGVLLRENGAATSEIRAAARYFGSAGLGYESSVMRRTSCIQIFIDQGTITSSCERLIFIP